MNAERWQKIEKLYHSAAQREQGERSAFLAEACQGDEELRREVESLLSSTVTTALVDIPNGKLAVGARLGPYRIETILGVGGMGEVYRAVDTRLDRNVAIKISREQFSARFQVEAKAISSLNHPNICTLYDVGHNYLVTELVVGETLRQWMSHAAPEEQRIDIARQVLEALRAAHDSGIVHRDLKPENIMVRRDGYVKVLDFGLAKRIAVSGAIPNEDTITNLSLAGQILGTVAYMSPEQIRQQEIDGRSDLFAFGIIFCEMLTGEHPWRRQSAVDTLHAILHEDPPPIRRAGPVLDAITRKLLRKTPAERYPSAQAVLEALAHRAEINVQYTAPERASALDSIAVLPFVNAGGDADTDYLCDGITESLINHLAEIPKLRVVPRSTVFRFKAADIDLKRAMHELNARTLLTGRVLQRNETLNVQAELVDAAAGAQLWGQRYNRKITDLAAVEEEIALEIVSALQVRLNSEQQRRFGQRSTDSGEAYQLFLRGRYLWNKRTRESLERAIEYFRQAIDRDPVYALAYAGLADSYVVLGSFAFRPPTEIFPLARAAAKQALQIDEGLAEAHVSLAIASMYFDFDNATAGREFRRALTLNSNYAVAHQWYGALLCWSGDFTEGLGELEEAQRLEPLSPMINVQLGVGLYLARRYEEAARVLLHTIGFEPAFWPAHHFLGTVYAQQGDSRAMAELEVALEQSARHPLTLSGLGRILARAGQRERAREIIEELNVRARDEYVSPTCFAAIHLELGDENLALERLQDAVGERSPWAVWLRVDPSYDALRADARFTTLIEKMFA
jgi:serine/threonine protein kinase/tetratricopeptide (TPR) repeat protein